MQPSPDIAALATRHDRHGMAEVISRTPDQIHFALTDPDFPRIEKGGVDNAVVIGMGGSALPVDVLNDAFSEQLRVPVVVSRDYNLPAAVNDRTLLVGSSFSGNTEETLAPLADPSTLPPNVVAISAGGRLADLARDRGYPLIVIPRNREVPGFQPRCATGYFVTYLARLLADAGILENPEPTLEAAVPFLRGLDLRGEAESVAHWIAGRIPVFYTDQSHERSIARIAKIKVNENAKCPAFFNSLPEVNHNEMIGLSRPVGEFAVIYLRDPASHERVHRRFDVMHSVFEDKGLSHVEFKQWQMPGSTNLEKIFAALNFADWCSYTLALLAGLDPSPVELVEEFKGAL